MTSPITSVFSTPIYHRQLAGQEGLNQTLERSIKDMAANMDSHDLKRAHHGGFYSDGTYFQQGLPGVAGVIDLFRQGLDDCFRELGSAETIKSVQLQGWVALTNGGDYQTPHVHGGSTVSGVYYVQMPQVDEPAGCIDFITRLDVQEMAFLKGLSRSYCRIQPRSGP